MIRGVALKNFMSYEDAYVPLERGLNLICGPNGAGKSSILLAISVVLGQAYTERAKRLSDLIRWGAEEGRITLLVSNHPRNGHRPFPQYHTDTVSITRILKSNGTYSYLLQERPVPKTAISEAFRSMGLNPDNMLIIMHQLMVAKFATIPPAEKLKMLEEAVGFQSYRADVLEAHQRLERLAEEDESIARILESTKETHDYWRREYEKLLRKRQLEAKFAELRRELLWAKIERRLRTLAGIESKIGSRRKAVESIEAKLQEAEEAVQRKGERFSKLRSERSKLEAALVEAVRLQAAYEAKLELIDKLLSRLKDSPQLGLSTETGQDIAKSLSAWKEEWEGMVSKVHDKASALSAKLGDLEAKVDEAMSGLIDARVNVQVLGFKRRSLLESLSDLEAQHRMLKEEVDPLIANAEKLGPRFENPRRILDVMMESAAVEEELRPLAHLSDDVERMYSSYASLYEDLRQKAEQIEKNRREAIEELEKRIARWREVLEGFLDSVSKRYNEILSQVGARGLVRLTNPRNIKEAGLDVQVAFKGGNFTSLDSYSQSGGERSVALMAFLLALQQHTLSPFRAIDEFDVHMDPKNRETISTLIMSSTRELGDVQYVAITPGQVNVADENIHVIVVQNVEGTSLVSELR